MVERERGMDDDRRFKIFRSDDHHLKYYGREYIYTVDSKKIADTSRLDVTAISCFTVLSLLLVTPLIKNVQYKSV